MGYTLNVEPEIVHKAESYAVRNGTTLDAMVRAYLLVVGVQGSLQGKIPSEEETPTVDIRARRMKIGSMRDEVKLPNEFDEEFDRLDAQVSSCAFAAHLAPAVLPCGSV